MRKSSFCLLMVIILILIISFINSKGQLVEELEIPIGVGYDITKANSFIVNKVPILVYSFEGDGKITSNILTGESSNMGETRENRQLKASRKFLLGLNRIFIFSEEASREGIRNIMDILVNNADINDRALCVVCKGKAEDMLKYKVKGYPSSAEYVYGMAKSLKQFNFIPMQFTVMDLVVRLDAEGRNIMLPYVEIKEDHVETTGMAIFKKDKLVGKADIKETRIISLLKESGVKGILTIQKGPKQYINCYTQSKRKITCVKKDGNYRFIINLDLRGQIVSNSLYENVTKDIKDLKSFEEEMKKSVEKMCEEEINKIKCEYKADVLDLGRVAAAKYGRNTGKDWDSVICDSLIEVKVKFIVDTEGRGDY